ncbi:MAG: SAM-dependent methyltransferase [Candidatus Rokuibacteriota bacterium]|nr:MAG: SAM-dependent methyltransferase [Candidatus Rokubacteria bacterium]
MTLHRRWLLTVAAILLGTAAAGGCAPGRRLPDVPYVVTPERVIEEMLQIASVGPNDLLYDLGSGDGRIVIAAARKFGTRGVGIEIDPALIEVANENARQAGVTHLVRFVHGDIFVADFAQATVVTLYLLPELNLRLHPRLLTELAPGTRVVSHNYDMGSWVPQRFHRVTVDSRTHYIYFWVVPTAHLRPS